MVSLWQRRTKLRVVVSACWYCVESAVPTLTTAWGVECYHSHSVWGVSTHTHSLLTWEGDSLTLKLIDCASTPTWLAKFSDSKTPSIANPTLWIVGTHTPQLTWNHNLQFRKLVWSMSAAVLALRTRLHNLATTFKMISMQLNAGSSGTSTCLTPVFNQGACCQLWVLKYFAQMKSCLHTCINLQTCQARERTVPFQNTSLLSLLLCSCSCFAVKQCKTKSSWV